VPTFIRLFLFFLASNHSQRKQDTQVRQLICHQVVDVPGEPLLLPDRQVQVGCEMDIDEARNWNTYYQSLPKSSRRHRKFVFGAIYQHFYPGFYEVDHMTMGDVDLVVFDMSTQTTSVLKIRSAAADVALMEAIVTLGECMPKGGNCRKNAGDLGQMYALGYRSKKMQKVYVQLRKKTTRDAMTDVCTRVLPFLKKEYPEVLSDIQTEERSGLKALMPALEEMGGEEGPGGSIMLSRNLGNSSHFDTSDNSFSCSIWGEKHQRRAESWYFVLPNMSFNGSSGIVIRLRHGVAISWDGRIHRHCSSVPDPGPDNNVYGCMFGSCRG
jgi:ribosomal protein S4